MRICDDVDEILAFFLADSLHYERQRRRALMYCPKCHNRRTRINATHNDPQFRSEVRRRECAKCHYKFNTEEKLMQGHVEDSALPLRLLARINNEKELR